MNFVAHVAGLTLVHFLWEGSILAAVYALLKACLPDTGARLRYGLACVFLCASTIAAAATACYEAAGSAGSIAPASNILLASGMAAAPERLLPLLTWFWFAGTLLLSLRLGVGAVSIHNLRRHSSEAAGSGRRSWLACSPASGSAFLC